MGILISYQYSSIGKSISGLAKTPQEASNVAFELQGMCFPYFSESEAFDPRFIVLQTDSCPVGKAHSPTLENRTYIPVPNTVIKGNKPLDIGYEVSYVNVSSGQSKWSLPLSIERITPDQSATQTCLNQLKSLLSHPDLGLSNRLVVNTLDSKYGTASYLCPAFEHENLVSLPRLRSNIKVWKSADKVSKKVYGEKFYLRRESGTKTYKKHPKTGLPYEVYQRSIFELPFDDELVIDGKTSKDRKLRIQINRWNNMMIRSRNGYYMKDKPFDLLAIKVEDAHTGKLVFDREMFVAISGKRKQEISSKNGYQTYRQRYDIVENPDSSGNLSFVFQSNGFCWINFKRV